MPRPSGVMSKVSGRPRFTECDGFDTIHLRAHPNVVNTLRRRLPAVLLAIALAVGQSGVCAGWMATPEARMACCLDEACPMHALPPNESDATHSLTQADADRCCAASEQDESAQSPSPLPLAIPFAEIQFLDPVVLQDAAARAEAWRTSVPLPAARIPRHLALSVLLV